MAIIILPDAQEDLLSLQAYMFNKWSETDWLNVENEIFDKLTLRARKAITCTFA
jgi:hypothetical protein